MARFLAIDLGGTKTSVSVGDESGRLLASQRMPTEASGDPVDWRDRVARLIGEVVAAAGCAMSDIAAVGLAVPGPMSVTRGMVLEPPNMPAWRDVPVKQWIQDLTRLPVFINNDANAAALAEYTFGQFRGTPDLVYLTMSTGVGGGVISGGALIQGADDLAGEVGHMVLDARGPVCPCGQRGCWEMYCGGRNVALRVQAMLRDPSRHSLILEEAGGAIERIDFACIERALRRGDHLATEVWDEFMERLAHGIGTVAMCCNPRAIVLGTIAVHMQDLIWPRLNLLLHRYAWRQSIQGLAVRPTTLGSRIGDLGALALALRGVGAHPVMEST